MVINVIDYINLYGEYCEPIPDYLEIARGRYMVSEWYSRSSGEIMNIDYVISSAEALAEVDLEVAIRKVFLDSCNGHPE